MDAALPKFRALLAFFALAFALSWTCWALAALMPGAERPLKIAGTFGPAVAALILVRSDRPARRALLRRLCRWRVPPRIHAYALGLPVAGILLALVAARLVTGEGPIRPDPMPVFVPLMVFAYVLVFSVAGEELGWRGFALPILIARHGLLGASLGLGAVWALWHAPLFFLPGDFHAGIPPALFGLQIVASSFVYTHLHVASGGSLVPAHLFHAAFNTCVGLFPVLPAARGGDVTALAVAVLLLTAVALLTARALRRPPG